jgi:Protein of unknown function (DUF3253)
VTASRAFSYLRLRGPMPFDQNAIETTLLRLIAAHGPGKTLDPTEIARALGGDHPDGWGPLMQPIRRVAVALAEQGRVVILRKGKPADPRDFKGVYRLTAPRDD